jgi:hypothetical protein
MELISIRLVDEIYEARSLIILISLFYIRLFVSKSIE